VSDTRVIEVNMAVKCVRCKRGGATPSGYCLKCIVKNLKEGKYDHVLERYKQKPK
jgi:hypothetical protein